MPVLKNKERLYLALCHRHDQPGYHWAILLCPKDPERKHQKDDDCGDEDVNDSIAWDVETFIPTCSPDWHPRERMIDQLRTPSLVARILLAKFDTEGHARTVDVLRDTFSSVGEKGERPWALRAVEQLMQKHMVHLKVRDLDDLEERARIFAGSVMDSIRARKLNIDSVDKIPVLDLRFGP